MKKERIMITKMYKDGPYIRIFGYSMVDGFQLMLECFGDNKEAVKMVRTAYVIARGSVMHV